MKKKPLRRGGWAGGGTRTGGDDSRDLFYVQVASAYVEHGSHQVAHHVVEESIAADAVDKERTGVGILLFPG